MLTTRARQLQAVVAAPFSFLPLVVFDFYKLASDQDCILLFTVRFCQHSKEYVSSCQLACNNHKTRHAAIFHNDYLENYVRELIPS